MNRSVDYDEIAAAYESRYDRNDYRGVETALAAFVGTRPGERVLDVGCGTGHWVHVLRRADVDVVGIDPSRRMLAIARARLPDARLIRARAEALPCRTATFDRMFCVNALHHFTDRPAFFREARRLLVAGGGLLTIGLDPHTGQDRWWIYDYFPSALAEDQRRYLPAGRIRELMEASSFVRSETREIQHLPAQMTVSEAARGGFLDRTSTSQLMVISEAEYEAGMHQIHADRGAAGEKMLRSDLRLYATIAWAD